MPQITAALIRNHPDEWFIRPEFVDKHGIFSGAIPIIGRGAVNTANILLANSPNLICTDNTDHVPA